MAGLPKLGGPTYHQKGPCRLMVINDHESGPSPTRRPSPDPKSEFKTRFYNNPRNFSCATGILYICSGGRCLDSVSISLAKTQALTRYDTTFLSANEGGELIFVSIIPRSRRCPCEGRRRRPHYWGESKKADQLSGQN